MGKWIRNRRWKYGKECDFISW